MEFIAAGGFISHGAAMVPDADGSMFDALDAEFHVTFHSSALMFRCAWLMLRHHVTFAPVTVSFVLLHKRAHAERALYKS
jgi:hypothetical protein